ncbi:kinesin-like protein KIF26B [Aplochiton taeniatus]
MTSLSGAKERSVTSRSRKYGMTDTSPTKSASFSPETWYRKAYEESRAGSRPAPEGAGSMPSSTGSPSPGSGTSSPGSFSGSPGTISPGIGTCSPGSLGGSPGFGTGSPGSGSGSSPGSERGIWCENCNARLAELKQQALKLLIPGPYSNKDPSFPLLLHDKLQVPNSACRAWSERDSRCEVCSTALAQLKQEAVHTVLTMEHWDLSPPASPCSPPPPPPPGRAPASNPPQPPLHNQSPTAASRTAPAPAHQGVYPRHGSLGLGSGGERRSPGYAGKTGGAVASHSPGHHGNAASGGQTHHMSRTNGGVTLYPYQNPQMISEGSREGQTENALNRYNTHTPLAPALTTAAPPAPSITMAASTTTSAAASFFARAAQRLNLSSKKRKQRLAAALPPVTCDPPLFPSNFSGALQMAPPPAPPCLLRAANKIKDTPGLGKVKVMVRVCPVSPSEAAESSSFLKVDPRKKQVTIMDPTANQTQGNPSQKRAAANQVPPKMFAFDAAFSHDASQAEVCAGTVAEVIQSVVNGADGCVFCFGHSKLGKSYTMIGSDASMQTLGIIPCAISWLFKLIDERKEKTAARFSVRVSAVEVWGKEENLKDLLSEVATGSLQDGQSPGVYLCEDPICGMQLQNQSELRAPTAEKAAFFLDAAIAARRSSQSDVGEEEQRNSHMLFTLHIYQYRIEKKTGKGGMSGGRSRLHLIDLGSCVKVLGKGRETSAEGLCLSLSALGNVILSLVNGSKHIPYKDSKLTMLLRESLGNMNCRTTMIAHISASPSNFSETLSTLQVACRVLRMKKKKPKVSVQYTSSSSGGESSCEEGRMRRPTQLRPFPPRGGATSDRPLPRLSRDHDDYSSSEHSCDTVIYVGPTGGAVSDRELTDNEGPPECVPIIPALLRGPEEEEEEEEEPDHQEPHQQQQQDLHHEATQLQAHSCGPLPAQPLPSLGQALLGHPLAPVPEETAECLKCNTFAELQERLDCIDGSEEVPKFPSEEVPSGRAAAAGEKEPSSLAPCPGQASPPGARGSPGAPQRMTNEQQLQEIREVVEEAELAQTMIQSLGRSSGTLGNGRSVTGSSGGGHADPLQRTKTASLNDSRESLSSDGKTRPLGSPRLGVASLTRTSDYRPPSSPSQRCKVYTQKGVMPGTPPLSSQSLAGDSLAGDSLGGDSLAGDSGRSSTESPLQQETLSRTSPVGMSPQVLKRAGSLSNSLGSAETLCEDDVPQIPLDVRRHSPGLSVAAAPGELRLLGEDEMVFTLGADAEASSQAGGRPSSTLSFTSDCSVIALSSGSRPVSVVSSTDHHRLDRYGDAVATAGLVAMAETAMARLRVGGEGLLEPGLLCSSSVTSWLSELSVASEGESLHSFSQCHSQGEALAEPCPTQELLSGAEGQGAEPPGAPGGLEGEPAPSGGRPGATPLAPGKAGVQPGVLVGTPTFSPFKSAVIAPPCAAVRPMVLQEPTILSSSHSKTKHPLTLAHVASLSSEMTFHDPWMRRGGGGLEAGEWSREVDGCERMMMMMIHDLHRPLTTPDDLLRTSSLPRGWHRVNRNDGLDGAEYRSLGVTTSTPCSPRATLDRRGSSGGRLGPSSSRQRGIPPLPPVRKSSLDQRNRALGPLSPLHGPSQGLSFLGSSPEDLGGGCGGVKHRGADSSRLFSAKLEQLANRTSSLGRSQGGPHSGPHYDCFSLERGESLRGLGGALRGEGGALRGEGALPRTGRSLTRAGSVSSPNGSAPGPQSPRTSQSKMSAVSKLLMASPKTRSLSSSSTKTLSFSTKSLPQAASRSASLPPNGKTPAPLQNQAQNQNQNQNQNQASGPGQTQNQNQNQPQGSWSTQSLSRSRGGGGGGGLSAKLPLRAVNGRISELLQGSGGSRSPGHGRAGGSEAGEERGGGGGGGGGAGGGEERPAAVVQTLPSPYSKITAPRRPQRCSSGHASDNSSVLSGELPPAMGRTALFYHSGGSSGYESMIRDSEATGSASSSSAQDSVSEQGSSTSSSSTRRGSSSKSSKKSRSNSNTGTQRHRLIPSLTSDSSSSPTRKPAASPSARWVDGPLGPAQRGATEPFEIKVYEIDDVERLQRRRERGSKDGVPVSAKLKVLEDRLQRIMEVRSRYQWLMKELERTKQHLMLEPEKWTSEFDLQQCYEVDSLEYLDALEVLTERLENRVNFCKAHLMMVTCFDVTCRRR